MNSYPSSENGGVDSYKQQAERQMDAILRLPVSGVITKAGINSPVDVANLTRVEDMVMRVAQAAEGLSGVVGGFIYGPRPESGMEPSWPPLEDRFERLAGMLDSISQTITRCTVAIGQRS